MPTTTADWPTYWFVRLERAVEEGDHEQAAEAQRQLRRLGVEVKYGAKPADRTRAPGGEVARVG
jgi:hypothetical protein